MKPDIINPSKHHAYQRFLAFNKANPNIKSQYKALDEWYSKNKDERMKYVYIPRHAVARFTQEYYIRNFGIPEPKHLEQMNPREVKGMTFINALPMFSAWRMSLSIYRIDEDIFKEMLKAPIPSDTPSDIFKRLPDFCVYIEFPHIIKMSDINDDVEKNSNTDLEITGFWAYLNHPNNTTKKLELNICLDVIENENYIDTLPSNSMIIEDGLTADKASDLVIEQYTGMPHFQAKALADSDKKTLLSLLPILLWLCAEEPDISNMIGEPLTIEKVREPKYSQKKKTGKFIPPSNPRIYNLGSRLGGEIRAFKDEINQSDNTRKSTTKRPHIRKGHWHGYWTGKGQEKQFIVKWLSATFVNASN